MEHWNPFGHRRVDLFGFVDILAIHSGKTYGLQVTSRGNISARVKKITVENADTLSRLKEAGWIIQVIGWGKVSVKRGSKSKRWEPKVVDL